ncbi:MAG: hypothetical protein LBV59_02910 [Sphingobacterium sp.]|uniref:hypothetical protein n=1 Tax=Sphingobacterium sp. TaxID=341027 RepID=UPI002848DB0C|nr:hypothetical protein [Sphingobacterium sp.]MDR3006855.1 hypothetical protein [Sphingobacterium sp.]
MISKKIIKKSLIAVGSALTLTVGIAFAVNAMENKVEKFSNNETQSTFVPDQWFQYSGPDSSDPNYEDEIMDPDNYTPVSSPSCSTGAQLCEVHGEDDGNDQPTEQSLEDLKNQILKTETQDTNKVRFHN